MIQSLPGITKQRGTQAQSHSRVLMLSHACNMALVREVCLCSQGRCQHEWHVNGSHYSHLESTWLGEHMGRSPGELKKKKKISGQLNQTVEWGSSTRIFFFFFKAPQVESSMQSWLRIPGPRLKWQELEGWLQNRRGWEIFRCSSQMGRENTVLMGRKISTIKNVEPCFS